MWPRRRAESKWNVHIKDGFLAPALAVGLPATSSSRTLPKLPYSEPLVKLPLAMELPMLSLFCFLRRGMAMALLEDMVSVSESPWAIT